MILKFIFQQSEIVIPSDWLQLSIIILPQSQVYVLSSKLLHLFLTLYTPCDNQFKNFLELCTCTLLCYEVFVSKV